MTRDLSQVIGAGHALDTDEREIAALAIQHVEEDEQRALDAVWDDEIGRRIDDIECGRVALVDGEETLRMIRAELAKRRDS